MKLAEGMKLIAQGWVQKPGGFRVRFEQMVSNERVTKFSPPKAVAPLDSDVTTWRYAWKLAMAARPAEDELPEGCMINVTVVDEKDNPVRYYITGKPEVFNPVQPGGPE